MSSSGQDKGHHGFLSKLKHPFHELKEKMEGTHLHDAKVHLIHKK